MEIKEAIDILKSCRKGAKYVDSGYVDSIDINAISIAISALEKQEGKKPGWNCPCCHSDRISVWQDGGFVPTRFAYCPDCGQKLDWSNKQEVSENG